MHIGRADQERVQVIENMGSGRNVHSGLTQADLPVWRLQQQR